MNRHSPSPTKAPDQRRPYGPKRKSAFEADNRCVNCSYSLPSIKTPLFRIKVAKMCSVSSDSADSQDLFSQGSNYSNSSLPEVKREIKKVKRSLVVSNLDSLKTFFREHDIIFPAMFTSPVDLSVCI